jgi:protein TonB
MDHRLSAVRLMSVMLLASCSAPPGAPPPASAPAERGAAPPPAQAPTIPPLTLEGYKKEVAGRIAHANPEIFDEPVPEMLKSVVVLDITIDRHGNLARVAVRRSNGYKALENAAISSVRRAAPFAPPPWLARRTDGSVNFLETFLFRDDGRYRIRSLVAVR